MCNWDYEENMCIDWTAPVLSAGQYNWKQIYPATSIRSLNCQQEDHDIGGDCEVIYYWEKKSQIFHLWVLVHYGLVLNENIIWQQKDDGVFFQNMFCWRLKKIEMSQKKRSEMHLFLLITNYISVVIQFVTCLAQHKIRRDNPQTK